MGHGPTPGKKIIDVQDKKREKGGFPPFEVIFGHFGGFPVEAVCKESKLAEKTVHHLSGVISEVLKRVDLGPRHAGSAKSTLWRTSEMTPDGWCTVFSATLDSMGGRD